MSDNIHKPKPPIPSESNGSDTQILNRKHKLYYNAFMACCGLVRIWIDVTCNPERYIRDDRQEAAKKTAQGLVGALVCAAAELHTGSRPPKGLFRIKETL